MAKWTCSTRGQRRFFPPPWQFMAKRAESGTLQARLSREGYNHMFFPCVFFFYPLHGKTRTVMQEDGASLSPLCAGSWTSTQGGVLLVRFSRASYTYVFFPPCGFFSPLPSRNL